MKTIYIWLIALMALPACTNVLDETADKHTDEAIFHNAQMKMDDHNFDEAITLFESLDASFLARRDVAIIYASAYSGRCGLDFLSILDSIDDFDGNNSLFLPMMQLYPNATDQKIADCVKAEEVLKAIGDETVRTGNENILMGLSSLAKVGTVLSRFADTDNDGVVDPGFDHCSLLQFPDDAVKEVGTGIALAVTSISNAGTTISDGALTSVNNICGLNPVLDIFCTSTDKDDYSNPLAVSALRAVLGSTDQGIGACPGDFTACICP